MGLKCETLQILALIAILVGFAEGSVTAAERAQTGLVNLNNQQAFAEYPVPVAVLDPTNELIEQHQQLQPRQQEPLAQIESAPDLMSAQRRYLFAGKLEGNLTIKG